MRLRPRTVAGIAGIVALVGGVPATAASQAGKPQPQYALLCGVSQGPMGTRGSGPNTHFSMTAQGGKNSSPDGEYDVKTQPNKGDCDSQQNSGGNFTWAVGHAVVRPNEQGTEHANATGTSMVISGTYAVTFNGRINEYDFGAGGDPGSFTDASGTRTVYYDSFGPFNTEGGAQVGNHFRGNYRTEYYQFSDSDDVAGHDLVSDNDRDESCPVGGMNYCFEAILSGQIN